MAERAYFMHGFIFIKLHNLFLFLSIFQKLTGHHHLEAYEDIKASGSAVSSEDSCYGSNELSRSSSNAHGVARPLLTPQHRSSSLSSTSVEYAVPAQRQQSSYINKTGTIVTLGVHQSMNNADDNLQQEEAHHLKTFRSSSSSQYNLKKTVQSLARRPVVNLQSTYLTYDAIDAPPPPLPLPSNHLSTSSSSTTSSSSREYSI
jgi:hypothetical protein